MPQPGVQAQGRVDYLFQADDNFHSFFIRQAGYAFFTPHPVSSTGQAQNPSLSPFTKGRRNAHALFFINLLGQTVADAVAAPRVAPVDRSFIADDVAGAAFEAGLVDDAQQLRGLVEGVAAGRAGLDTGVVVAFAADFFVDDDVGLFIDNELGQLRQTFHFHNKALPILMPSAARS